MAGAFESRTQVPMVIDLSVVRDPDGRVFVRHPPMASTDFHDRKSPTTESDTSIDATARIIRSAVLERIAHAQQGLGIDGSFKIVWNCDAAHSAHSVQILVESCHPASQ